MRALCVVVHLICIRIAEAAVYETAHRMKKHLHIVKLIGFDMLVLEFGPVGVFYLVFYLAEFFAASLALAVATLATLIASKIVNRRVPWFALLSGTVTILTAGLTYFLTSPTILIVKDTVYYGLFAAALGVSVYRRLHLFRTFFGHVFAITDEGWRTLERRWALFFLAMAVSNDVVSITMTADAWVIYTHFALAVFLAFGFYQLRVSMRHRLAEADAWGLRKLSGSQAASATRAEASE